MTKLISLIQAAIWFGTVIMYGASGEILTEKSGNLNLGVPGIMIYNFGAAVLRAIGDTRAATFFLFVAVAVNAVLDLLFVGELHFGIAGAAWATVLSQLLSALCCLIYIARRDRDLLCSRYEFHLDKSLVGRTLTFGFSSALHQSSLYIGKIFVQGAVNTLGTPGIAAYTATTRIEGFANSFGTSVGQSLSVFVSQNYGAKNADRVRDGLKEGLKLGVCLGLVLSALMFLCARVGVVVFLNDGEAEAIGFGVTYPRPTWGNMLNGANNATVIGNYWWQWVFTSLFLAITTICINIVGDALRDVMDPKSNIDK